MSDVNTHVPSLNIFIPEIADFTYPETGAIQKRDHGLDFNVGNRGYENINLLLGRHVWKVSIKLAHGELGRIPRPVKYINEEKPQLRNSTVHGAVIKIS